jgi:hypothetical protein
VYKYLSTCSEADQKEAIALANKNMTEWFSKKSAQPVFRGGKRGW